MRWTFFLLLLAANDLLADESSEVALGEILVTAPLHGKSSEATLPVTVLSGEELQLKNAHSIGEALKNELGINSQSFGPGVGTPVIRGQAGPRVRVLANGLGSNDVSAISPDHPTSVEPLFAERIEVLRGAATLLYGSGAMGGVVNIIDNRIPGAIPNRLFSGALEQRFDSVSDETTTALKVDGGHQRLAYHLDGFFRQRDNMGIGGKGIDVAHALRTDPSLSIVDNPNGYLNNTGAEAISGSAGASWMLDNGFAGASINHLENNYGIAPDGTGAELVRIAMRQDKYDFKSELKDPLPFAKMLRTKLGYTDYQHTEIANGEPGAFFTNKAYEGRLELTHQDIGAVQGAVGFQAQVGDFNAIEKLTGEAITPRTQTASYGVFAVESLRVGDVTYQAGLRVEQTDLQPEGLSSLSYTPVSASLSGLWKINAKNQLNLGITRASRAPQVQELLSNGYHDATRSYERGSLNLKEETSYNLDLGYRFKGDWLRAEFDVFHNWASDYIFQRRSGEFVDEEGLLCAANCKPVVVSDQADAIFKGFEAKLMMPMMENRYGILDLTLFSDYTRGQFVDGKDVPRMPPLRYGMQLDYNLHKLTSFLRLTRAEQQIHAGEFETTTAGYFLLNAGAQYPVKLANHSQLLLFAKGNNLLNENIRNSTSYLRNFAPEPGRGAEIGFRLTY